MDTSSRGEAGSGSEREREITVPLEKYHLQFWDSFFALSGLLGSVQKHLSRQSRSSGYAGSCATSVFPHIEDLDK